MRKWHTRHYCLGLNTVSNPVTNHYDLIPTNLKLNSDLYELFKVLNCLLYCDVTMLEQSKIFYIVMLQKVTHSSDNLVFLKGNL
jgi:hypothetical protein